MGQTNGGQKQPQDSSLLEIDFWKTNLGLFPVPLNENESSGATDASFVLLNGSRGNFCLQLNGDPIDGSTRNKAWSANVGHYVAVAGNDVEVQRWDESILSKIARFDYKTVQENIEAFYAYLEKGAPNKDSSIVTHAIDSFRRLRAVLNTTTGTEIDGIGSLQAFLYLLACATVQNPYLPEAELQRWNLPEDSVTISRLISTSDWEALFQDLVRGRPVDRLRPDFDLVLRHASGQLFQEAGYAAVQSQQFTLPNVGFLPSAAVPTKDAKGTGLHFTPASIARTVVEESLRELDISHLSSITIFDPACGSGEFLREALRQLQILRFSGRIVLIGWDESQAAYDMAKFALGWDTRHESNQTVEVIIRQTNSLSGEPWPMDVDMILMNPPFKSWPDMEVEQQDVVGRILGGLKGYMPDLSHAFLVLAASSVRSGGVIGSILPASFLNSGSAEKLRRKLGEQLSPRIIAKLGSHSLFANALVDVAFYIGSAGISNEPTLSFWSDYRISSSAAGLRTLRKIRNFGVHTRFPVVDKDGYSIYQTEDMGHSDTSWTPRPYKAWKLHQQLAGMSRVKDLFDVKKGSITGNNNAFIITREKWLSLPKKERLYFRPAVVNKSLIRFGFLVDSHYVFYPYGKRVIEDEQQLIKIVPTYYSQVLRGFERDLKKRPSATDAWWELDRHRDWQIEESPKIISTHRGDAGSFAWDAQGRYIIIQGNGWVPRNDNAENYTEKVALAYLSILNSSIFSQLLSSVSNHVGGGQWDLSKRFVDDIPIPDLMNELISGELVSDLSELGRSICSGSIIDEIYLSQLVRSAYGLIDEAI